ncbi:hypothetical protein [Alkalihalobacillus deserti]|uniref:hypothetical protein n=1 Tax=Alkalihalobacillus deserti TaxID=2879466 RepID=UPI001D137599|nr:hypothetical protein [Alkalihalobacillus deserti]
MQIQNHLHTSGQQKEKVQQMRDGEIYQAKVKEHTGKDEALLSIRGREVNVKFEGEIPKTDRVTVQIVDSKQDVIKVRVVEENRSSVVPASRAERETVSQALRQLGVLQPTPELKQAASMILDKGIPLTKESVQDLQRFMKGKAETRLQTVQAIANKRLDVTETHLRSVHEAMHGRPLNEVLNDLSKELDQDFKVQPPVRERLDRSTNQDQLLNRIESNAIREQQPTIRQSQEGRVQEQIRQVSESVQKETSVARAVDRIQSLVNNPQINMDTSRTLERSISESIHLDQVAKERVTQVLSQIERTSSAQLEQNRAKEARMLIQREGLTQEALEQVKSMINQRGVVNTETDEQVDKILKQAEQILAVARERLVSAVHQLSSKATDLVHVTNRDLPSLNEAVKEGKAVLEKEANFDRAIQQIQSLLNGQAGLDESLKVELTQTSQTARDLQQQGREMKARQEVAAVLDKIEQTSKQVVTLPSTPEARAYSENEQFQTSVEMASKSIAVTTVTEKLAQMTADFKHLQRDISRTLDQVNRQIEQFRNMAQPVVKPLLETTIKKLDNAILKSEMMLLTDMKTERQLMQASSQLAEARKLLSRGKHREANQIVHDVKQLVDKMNFQPAESKVKHYTAVNERALREASLPSQSFSSQYSETIRGPLQEGSPRAMFETVRSLGLNRDSEVAQFLASGKEQQQEQAQRNLKTSLMQLAQGEEETKVQQLANQALQNVTGQQLMSRSDQQGNLQSLFFQLPFLLQEKVENLQVFVNSRNESEKVDWENCSLFFLMETPKMGEIGIAISANEKQLSVTVKNDKTDFQMKMEPLVQLAVEKLSEIGYSINGIKYAKFKNDVSASLEKEEGTSRQKPVMTEKGFDLKI